MLQRQQRKLLRDPDSFLVQLPRRHRAVQFPDADAGGDSGVAPCPADRPGTIGKIAERLRFDDPCRPHRRTEPPVAPRRQHQLPIEPLLAQKGNPPVSMTDQKIDRQLHAGQTVGIHAVNVVPVAARGIQPHQRQIRQFTPPFVEPVIQCDCDRAGHSPAPQKFDIRGVDQFGPVTAFAQFTQYRRQSTADKPLFLYNIAITVQK